MTGAHPTAFPAPPPALGSPPRNGAPRPRPFFLLALLLGLGLNILFFGLFRIATPLVAPVKFPPVYVHYAGATGAIADAALSEQAELFDSESLFLPTPWNFASRSFDVKPLRPQPFADFPTSIESPAEANFTLKADAPAGNLDPVAALRPGQWIFLGVLGQAPNPTAKLPPRGALLRVTRLDPAAASTRAAGPAVLDETLSATIVPKSTQNLEALWGPATFLLLFSGTGSVGEPLLVNSSGIDAVDDDWRNWLDDNFRRHPLPPGTYQAVVGP
jgi:hypothetical protein